MGVNCGLVNRLTDGHFPSAVKLSLFLRLNDVSDANLILLPTSDGPNTHFDNPPVTLGSGSLSSPSSATQMWTLIVTNGRTVRLTYLLYTLHQLFMATNHFRPMAALLHPRQHSERGLGHLSFHPTSPRRLDRRPTFHWVYKLTERSPLSWPMYILDRRSLLCCDYLSAFHSSSLNNRLAKRNPRDIKPFMQIWFIALIRVKEERKALHLSLFNYVSRKCAFTSDNATSH